MRCRDTDARAARRRPSGGSEHTVAFVPKVKVDVIAEAGDVDKVIELIAATARTGKIRDGKIWSLDLDRLMRIRTGERGDHAI